MARRKKTSKAVNVEARLVTFTQNAITESDQFRQEVLFPAIIKANAQYRGDLPKRLTPKKRRRIFYQKTRQRVHILKGELIDAAFSAGRDVVRLMRQGFEDDAEIKVLHEVVNWHLRNRVNTFGLFINTGEDAYVRNLAAVKVSWRYVKLQNLEDTELPDGTTAKVVVEDVVEDRPILKAVPIERLRWSPNTTAIGVPWEDADYLIHSEFLTPKQLMDETVAGKYDPNKVKLIIDDYALKKTRGAEADTAGSSQMRFPDRDVRDSTRGYAWGRSANENDIEICEVQARFDLNGDGYAEKILYTFAPASGILLTEPVPLPWPDGLFNTVIGTAIPRAYRLHGENIPEQIEDLQAAINSQVNRLDDALAMIVEQGWIVENGSNTDLEALATARYITTTDDINAVKPRDHQEVPQTYYSAVRDKESEIDERLGITSTYLGNSNVPASAPATTSVQNVQQSGKRIAFVMNSLVHTLYLHAFKKFAIYVATYEDDEEIFEIANEASKTGQMVDYFPNPQKLAYNLRTNMSFGPNDSTIQVAQLVQVLSIMKDLAGVPLQGPQGPVTPNLVQLVNDIMRYQNVPDAQIYWLPVQPPPAPPAATSPPGSPVGPAAGGGNPTVSSVGGPELPLDAILGSLTGGSVAGGGQ